VAQGPHINYRGEGRPGVLKVLSALNGAVCLVTRSRWLIAAWMALHFSFAGKAPFIIHCNQAEGPTPGSPGTHHRRIGHFRPELIPRGLEPQTLVLLSVCSDQLTYEAR
jgi:hypothetical protein